MTAKQALVQLKQSKKIIAHERNKMRKIIDYMSECMEAFDEGLEAITEGIDKISEVV